MSGFNTPWTWGPLKEWSIVGMNHYHVNGTRMLFISMTRGDYCITEEGEDDEYLWNRLCHKAWARDSQQGPTDEQGAKP